MKSKKVAIATCYYENNYGSKLQAYATQYILTKLKIENDFLYCSKPINYMRQSKFLYYMRKIQDKDFEMVLGAFKKRKNQAINKSLETNLNIRKKKFNEFVKGNFKISHSANNLNELKVIIKEYDTILVGSDQLWSPSGIEQGFYTLENLDDIKKISYSTSFGVNDINNSQIKKIKKALTKFDNIGVREETGRTIIKKYLDRDCTVVLDPTLLISKLEWDNIIRNSNYIIDEPYIFFYFLGDNPEQHKYVKQLKEKTGYKIVGLLHLDCYIPEDEKIVDISLYDVDPFGFVNLIKNAQFICTDSFHGTAFSIIYQKKFVTFKRNLDTKRSVNSRVINLLKSVGLLERLFDEENLEKQIKQDISYQNVDKKLIDLRKKSYEYLKTSLEVEND